MKKKSVILRKKQNMLSIIRRFSEHSGSFNCTNNVTL